MIKKVFEDHYILILEKPPGLVVDKSETQKEETLEEILQNEYKISINRSGIVHRLDKDTSGLILVAKTKEVLDSLQSQFKERIVKKQYLALVHGHIMESGKVEGAIDRNPGNREKFTVVTPSRWSNGLLEGGREAVTEYEPEKKLKVKSLDSARDKSEKLKILFPEFNKIQMRKLERMDYGSFTLLRCYPRTGRTHQIRVHLKYIGHPIVADEKYVGRKMYRLDKRWCLRQFLHAAKIGFKHPVSGEWVEFESGLPDDLKKVLGLLRSLEQ